MSSLVRHRGRVLRPCQALSEHLWEREEWGKKWVRKQRKKKTTCPAPSCVWKLLGLLNQQLVTSVGETALVLLEPEAAVGGDRAQSLER